MKKMKIGIVVIGDCYTVAAEERAVENQDLRKASEYRADEAFVEQMAQRVGKLLPADTEYFSAWVNSEEDAVNLELADAYVLVPLKGRTRFYSPIHAKNRPIAIYMPPYGEMWSFGGVFYPYFMRTSRKIDEKLGIDPEIYLAAGDEDFAEHMLALQARYKIRSTRVLCIGEAMYEPYHSVDWGYEMVRLIQQKFGLEWVQMGSRKFLSLFEKFNGGDNETVLSEAAENRMPEGYATAGVRKTYELYKKLIEETGANAFTVNCLWSVVHTGCGATSCYALSKLNDEGIVSACEADVTTLMNMLIVTYATGEPAFMLNPYLFPQDNKLFVSHCTSPRRHSLASDEKDDFNLYAYYEIPELPCGLQILKQPGPVTVCGISNDSMDRMVIVKGRIVRNTAFPSCRTQLEIDVDGSVQTLAENYEGRHWTLVYGDQAEKIVRLNKLLGVESFIL